MPFNKNFKLIIGCLLLFVFSFKLITTVSGFQKAAKTCIAFADDNETQEDSEKKADAKSNFNFNQEFDCLAEDFTTPFIYLIISNLHPIFTHDFIADHFPAILTPPPNC